MKLNEQGLKAHKRIYYNGHIINFDEDKKIFKDVFYLTTFLPYAVSYAGENGIVSSYVLDKNVNIFNAKSKVDYNTIKPFLPSDLLPYLNRLANEDWVFEDNIFNQTIKNRFIKIIKYLEYDGFFNFEVDKKYLNRIKSSEYGDYINRVMINNPSIGIFDKRNLILVENTVDYKNDEEYKEFSILEKNFIAYNLLELLNENKFDRVNKEKLYHKLSNGQILTLSKEEIYDLIFSCDKDYILNNSEEFMKKFEYLRESTNPYKCIIHTFGARSYLLHIHLLHKQKLFNEMAK